jgi:hypothetical protein
LTNSPNHHQARQRLRWERMHVAIRCGLHADQPALLRAYLGLGRWLVQRGQLDDGAANRRMLQLLLDTAGDHALPWWWRSVCLEHVDRPLARLTTLPPAASRQGCLPWDEAVASARERLARERERLPLAPRHVEPRAGKVG